MRTPTPSMRVLCSITEPSLSVSFSKTAGRFHAAKGHFVEDLGNFLGNEKMEAKGKEERVEGKIEVQAAKEEEAIAGEWFRRW